MKCPVCQSPYNRIYDSRKTDDDKVIRRRECLDCGCRFYTEEVALAIVRKAPCKNRQKGEAIE